LEKEIPIKVWKSDDPDADSGSGPASPWQGLRSPCALVNDCEKLRLL